MVRKSMKKVVFGTLCSLLMAVSCGCSMLGGGYTSDEPCAWCGNTPTKKFETSKGEDCYVCEEHTHECGICGKNFDKELKHYTNMLDLEMFVCDDCYDDVQELNN